MLDKTRFEAVVADVKTVAQALIEEYGLKLAGPMGTGEMVFTKAKIAFNGSETCGHTKNSAIVIPWPAKGASGIAHEGEDAIAGQWFAGAQLSSRVCNGDCSYESFILDRVYKPEKWERPDEHGSYFQFTKTAFRPYDILVTSALLVLKQKFGQEVTVQTDGEDTHWSDAKLLCFSRLGYGERFVVVKGELVQAHTELSDSIIEANMDERGLWEPIANSPNNPEHNGDASGH